MHNGTPRRVRVFHLAAKLNERPELLCPHLAVLGPGNVLDHVLAVIYRRILFRMEYVDAQSGLKLAAFGDILFGDEVSQCSLLLFLLKEPAARLQGRRPSAPVLPAM